MQADRYVRANKDLKGTKLEEALKEKDWDPSVKSMCTLPDVLEKMSENLDWTQDLGDAFLGQQSELLDTAQRMRGKANDSGNLKTTEQQVVTVKEEKIIVIESPNPEVVYVPTYSPTVVYPGWYYSTWYYPPMYPYYPVGAGLVTFGVGVARRRGALGRLQLGLGARQRLHQPQQLQQLQSQHEHQSQQPERQPRELEPQRESSRRGQLQELEGGGPVRCQERHGPRLEGRRRGVGPGARLLRRRARARRQARTPSTSAQSRQGSGQRASGTSASSGNRAASGQKASGQGERYGGRAPAAAPTAGRAPAAAPTVARRARARSRASSSRGSYEPGLDVVRRWRLPRRRRNVPRRWRRTAQVEWEIEP